MHLSLELIHGAQGIVLQPSMHGALILLALALVNELTAFFPFALIVSSQLLFFKGTYSVAFVLKLLFLVALPIGIGSSLGTLPIFIAGYFGGKIAIEKFHSRLHFSWSDVESAMNKFSGRSFDKLVFVLVRMIPVLPSLPVDIACGIVRMDPVSYFVLTAVGFTVRTALSMLTFGLGLDILHHAYNRRINL